jgi:DNA-binding transcriptional ArsR family regulator
MMDHAAVFQTLGDPTRLRILDALREGEHAVGELVTRMKAEQSGISRHLRILHGAGFVRVRSDGPRRLYALRPEPFQELDGWLRSYRSLWEKRLDRFEIALARKTQARRGKARTDPAE